MSFGTILGNDALRARLEATRAQGKLSHLYLLCGPEGSGKHTLALWLAAALECQAPGGPCGTCPDCRKILGGIHPDVITCTDTKHKQFGVESARAVYADAYIRPNEGAHKVYILPQEMNLSAQNALLKLIEEPPAYCAFLILSTNPDQLLPTVRSRCQELRLSPLPDEILRSALRGRCPGRSDADYSAAIALSGGYLGQALDAMAQTGLSGRTAEFARCYASRDELGMLSLLVGMERLNRDDFCAEMERWQSLLHQALRCASGFPGGADAQNLAKARKKPELMSASAAISQAADRARSNVGVGHLCGALRATL